MVGKSSPSNALFHFDSLLVKVISVQVSEIVDYVTRDGKCTCTNGLFCLNFIPNKFEIH
jgi:hypothetical protein